MLTRSNLEFQPDARTIANGSSIHFGLYNKGGLVGLAKATRGHMAVGRLLSAACETLSDADQISTSALCESDI